MTTPARQDRFAKRRSQRAASRPTQVDLSFTRAARLLGVRLGGGRADTLADRLDGAV